MSHLWFKRYAWSQLLLNIGVILWGAFVRATGSGAGCGEHWPTCNGEVLPRPERIETVIEFAHRASSGVALLGTVVLFVWALRLFERGAPVRKAASWAMVFMLGEAAVGAVIVLFGLTGEDASMARAAVMAVHLGNTLLLLGALLLTAAWSSGVPEPGPGRPRWVGPLVALCTLCLLVLGASGAVAALGDTLFPAESLAHGLQQDLSPTAHLLVRLRLFHPLIAMGTAGLLVVSAGLLAAASRSMRTRNAAAALGGLILLQICVGFLNVALLAPVWMQILHLFVADMVWCAFVLMAANAMAPPEPAT